jgi:hypothetical protein
MDWKKIAGAALRIAKGLLPLVEAEFPMLKATAVAGAGLGLAGGVLDAVEAKGSPASIVAVGEAAMSTAQAAGLSSTDQKNAAGFVSAIGEFMPVVTALGSAGLSDAHATLLKTSADYLTAAASGVSAALSPAAEPAPAA